jgi:uncharacterized protein (DUF342 family)
MWPFFISKIRKMESTINLVWVFIGAATLLLTVIASIIKSSREAEQFKSWLKTHEKEITELKSLFQALLQENKTLKDNITSQNSQSMQENRRLENMIGQLSKTISQIDVKLSFLIDGRIKPLNNNEG